MGLTSFAQIPNNTASSWWKDPCLRWNVFYLFGCCLCPFYMGFDQSLLTGLQAVPQWKTFFGSPTGTRLGLISASMFLPTIFSPFLGDYISARWGRKVAIWVGSFTIIAGTFINAFATGMGMFIAGRVLIGGGGGMTKVAAPAMIQEFAHPRVRSAVVGVYYSFFFVGSIASAALCIGGLYIPGNWGWRFPCLFQVVGPVVVIAVTASMPESPRFLMRKGQETKAKDILREYHANGAEGDPLVEWEYEEIRSTLEAEESQPKSSYMDFFRTPGNRRRFIVVFSLGVANNWVGNGLVSYYLAPILNSVGVTDALQITGINLGLAAFNLVLAGGAGLNVDRVGRRTLFLTSFTGMFCSYVVITALSAAFAEMGNKAAGTAVIPFLFIFYGFYDIAITPLPFVYSSEICPYNLRSKGIAIFISSSNLFNAFNTFVNPIALKAIAWKYYFVYWVTIAFFGAVAWFFYYETKGLSLEEVSVMYDYPRKEARSKVEEMIRDEQARRNAVHLRAGIEGKEEEA